MAFTGMTSTDHASHCAENKKLSNNDIGAEARHLIAARGVPSKYPIIKGITNYGNCREREGF